MTQQHVETNDIVLAATLKVKGYKLDRIEKQGTRGTFCFADVDKEVLAEFDLGQAHVEPVAFNNAIKALTTATRRII
jgi:hypothetical protein